MHDFVFYYPEGHETHYSAGHPERPERINAVISALKERGWWNHFPVLAPVTVPDFTITNIHDPDYLSSLKQTSKNGGWLDRDTYTTPDSYFLALNTSGGTAAVAEAVWSGNSRRGFALTRPPGHHAMRVTGSGFCLINNIAVAAEYLIQEKSSTTGNPGPGFTPWEWDTRHFLSAG